MQNKNLKYRQAILVQFATEAGSLLGYLRGNYEIIAAEMPVGDLIKALDKLKTCIHKLH